LSVTCTPQVDPKDVEIGAQILAFFEHLSLFAEVIDLRFDIFDGSVYSPHLMRQSLALLNSLYRETVSGTGANGRQPRLLAWSRSIFQNTAKAIETHPEMTLSEYVPLIAARWDTIGLVFALLGSATYQINQNDPVLKREGMPGKDKHGLRKIAMAANDMCMQFSHKLGAMNDPLFWATLQRTVFLNEMHGSAGKRCCRPPFNGLAKKPRLQIMAGAGGGSKFGIRTWPPSGQGRRASPILPV
jgi:chromatin structure-remodeling complex subunit RSC3/30